MARVPDVWSNELLLELEWRRFELLIEGLFRHHNEWRAEGGSSGADGGLDLLLYAPGESKPTAAVQCKAYRSKQVGVAIVRELYGVMAAEGIPHGMVFTCGGFSADAEKFAENKSIDLVSGERLLGLIGELASESRQTLLREITAGDYTTPTCPRCRVKLVRRSTERGDFWGCLNYPRCNTKIYTAAAAQSGPESAPVAEVVEENAPCCQGCGATVEPKVVSFCRSPQGSQKFGGKILCRVCQSGGNTPSERATVVSRKSESLCDTCGVVLEAAVVRFCEQDHNRKRFGGKRLCRTFQPK